MNDNLFLSTQKYLDFKKALGKNYRKGTNAHHLLNNLLLGKPFYNGFTVTKHRHRYLSEAGNNTGI